MSEPMDGLETFTYTVTIVRRTIDEEAWRREDNTQHWKSQVIRAMNYLSADQQGYIAVEVKHADT